MSWMISRLSRAARPNRSTRRRPARRLCLDRLEDRAVPTLLPTGPEFHVNTFTTNAQAAPAIATDTAGDFVVAWQSNNQVTGTSGYDVYAQRYNAAGVAQGGEFRVNAFTTGNQFHPAVAMD